MTSRERAGLPTVAVRRTQPVREARCVASHARAIAFSEKYNAEPIFYLYFFPNFAFNTNQQVDQTAYLEIPQIYLVLTKTLNQLRLTGEKP